MLSRIFVKNILEAETNGFTGTMTFKVYGSYEQEYPGGYWETELEKVEDVSFTPEQLDIEGGLSEVLKDLKACYNIAI